MNNNEDAKIDEIVGMLDSFMDKGGGHMNVAVADAQAKADVQTMNSNECAGQNMACKVPTLHIGIDDND
ncbi:MAG: hypothetical protein K6F17_03325 [Lachnospiraceae bacterium]|jgi:hypothetical protein|nr:hypothetical protein [Lachnospiraceae bacterium]